MIYKAIGLMSGSSMDGLDIAYCILEETAGVWKYEIKHAECVSFSQEWLEKLTQLTSLSAHDLLVAHSAFGSYMGECVNAFIAKHELEHNVHLIASHGHTVYHAPSRRMTFQLGDGAALAAAVQLPVVSDLRALDIALGGQGAPIVPVTEKLLLNQYDFYLNLGGIANITYMVDADYVAFDICPANRVLNLLANELGMAYDADGLHAQHGQINTRLLNSLNDLPYYSLPFPKSLANEFGTNTVYKLIRESTCSIQDKLRTYCEHIATQIFSVIPAAAPKRKLLITGGGALNKFLVSRISARLDSLNIEVIVPDENLVLYKEALAMALIGVLRWREEINVLQSVTGASRSSCGGALWMPA